MASCDFLQKIGENIKKHREEKVVKGETLGKQLGVKKAYISQMENGRVDFRISTLRHIASVLDTNVSDLIDGRASIETQFEDYRFHSDKHQRVIDILVSRIEYLNEQIECERLEKSVR